MHAYPRHTALVLAALLLPVLGSRASGQETGRFVPDALAWDRGMKDYPPAKVIGLLRDDRCHVAFEAAAEMKRVGAVGVPAVMKMLDDPDPLVERVGLIAAANIGPAAKGALPHALRIIRANDPTKKPKVTELVRLESAILAVGGFGAAASEAVPLLLPYLERTERHFATWEETRKASDLCFGSSLAAAASLSLSRIGPAAATALPTMRKLATQFGGEGFAFPWAMADIGRLRPVTTAGVDAIVAALDAAGYDGHLDYKLGTTMSGFWAMGAEGVPAMLEVIRRPGTHPVARSGMLAVISNAARAPKVPSRPALDGLLSMASRSDLRCVSTGDWEGGRRESTCRKQALFYLRTLKDPRVTALFRSLLRDDDAEIAQYAREALRP
jgi:hypothetical protein